MSTGNRLLCVWIVALLTMAALFIPHRLVESKPAAEIAEGNGLFIENAGQFAAGAKFVQMDAQGSVWIAEDGIWVTRFSAQEPAGVNLHLRFEGANPAADLQPFDRKETQVSYLKDSDSAQWTTSVPVWGGVRYVNLYPGIDLVLDAETFDWRLEASPEADLAQVRLVVDGALAAQALPDSIMISSEVGDFVLPLPELRLENAVSGEVVPHPPAVELSPEGSFLVISPYRTNQAAGLENQNIQTVEGLKWATFLGGGANDSSRGIAVNTSQQVFTVGDTFSTDFPVTPGVIDPVNIDRDAFAAKLSSDGSTLIYATFLGGSGLDSGNDIAVAGSIAYIVGDTDSTDFPGAGRSALDKDAFVVSLNADGTGLNYSILYGGSDLEYGNAVAVDAGNAYVTGSTYSNDIHGGIAKKWDGFAAKFNSSGVLQYGVIFGGRFDDGAYDIAASGGNVFITGDSDSPDMGCGDFYGYDDAYLLKLGASGEKVFCKSLGGSGTDTGTSIAVESSGRGVIVGQTDSATLGSASGNSGGVDAFLAVLNNAGSAWEYVTFLGGSGADSAKAVILDRLGGIQAAGMTSSPNFPVSGDAQQAALLGGSDGFIVRYVPAWTRAYSSYFGGSGEDSINSLAIDLWGYTYLSGDTSSSDFPVTAGAYDTLPGGVKDGFAAKMGVSPTPGIVLKKFTNGYDADLAPGPSLQVNTAIQWRYDVFNTGETALSSVAVSDNQGVTITCPSNSLSAGASMSCTAAGTAQAGPYTNIGTVSANPPGGLPQVTDSDSSHYFGAQPAVVVVKSVSGTVSGPWFDANSAPGPNLLVDLPVFWKYQVTNTGNVSLGEILVTDSDSGLLITCPVNALAAGGSMNCTANAVASAGQHSNTATVSAVPPDGLGAVSDTDLSHYYGVSPALDVEKTVSLDGGTTWQDADSAPGPTLLSGTQPRFRITLVNTGDVPLSSILVSDSDFSLSGCPTSLAAGATGSCAIVTAAWTSGANENTGSAQASYTDSSLNSRTVGDSDKANYFGAAPGIDVIKEVSIDGGLSWSDANAAPGPTLLTGYLAPKYRFTVKNTGNVALSNVTLSDPQVTIPPECATGILQPNNGAPGGSDERTCTVTAVWAIGQRTNTASVSSSYTDSASHAVNLNDTDSANYFGASPAITIKKEVSVNNGGLWQDANNPPGPSLIPGHAAPKFRLTVTNTGNVTLSTLTLSDSKFSTNGCSIPGSLAPSASFTCTIDGIWTSGQQTNTATATGRFTDSAANTAIKSANDNASYFGASVGLSIIKYVSLDNGSSWEDANSAPGSTLAQSGPAPQFKFVVKNTGNVGLTVALSDSRTALPAGCQSKSLSANDSFAGGADEFECIYSVAWTAGAQTNTAAGAASYTDGAGNLQTVNVNDAANYFGVFTGLDVIKAVYDNNSGIWLDANTAPGPYLLSGGGAPQFRFTVKNTGNIALAVTLSDNAISLPAECAPGTLQPNTEKSCIVTKAWTIGQQSNTATANASFADSKGHPMNALDTDMAYYFGAAPAIQLQKLTNEQDPGVPEDLYILAGTAVTWKYNIVNSGNVALSGIVITDDNGTPGVPADDFQVCTLSSLGAGQGTVCFENGAAVEGVYSNTAKVAAAPPVGSPLQTNDTSRYFGAQPVISIVKSISGDGSTWFDANQVPGPLLEVGGPVYFKYDLSNDGNVALTSINVLDDSGVVVNCPRTTLDVSGPNRLMTCTASGTASAGQRQPAGTVHALPPGGLAAISASDVSYYYGYDPDQSVGLVLKTNGVVTSGAPGVYVLKDAQVTWTYVVINLTNQELTGIEIRDDHGTPGDLEDDLACPIAATLPASDSGECSLSEPAKEGQYTNIAVVTASLGGETVDDQASGSYFGARQGITLEKSISSDGITWFDADDAPGPIFASGIPLTWRYLVNNTSNVVLSDVTVTDSDPSLEITCPGSTLDPGGQQSMECFAHGISSSTLYSNLGTVTGKPPGGLDLFTANDACHYTGKVKLFIPMVLKASSQP